MGANSLAPPGKDGLATASSARKPRRAKLKDWTSTIICTCGCLYIISCSQWLLASSGLLGSLLIFTIGCVVASIMCLLSLVWLLYKTSDKFDPARERELRLQQLGLTCKASRAAAAIAPAGAASSTATAGPQPAGQAARGSRRRGQKKGHEKDRHEGPGSQQQDMGGPACTVVEDKVVLGAQAQLPPTNMLPARAVVPQPPTSATGTYSGVIWTVPGSTWRRERRADPFPPVCEGPKAISHRWHATLSHGKLTLYPAYGMAWQSVGSSSSSSSRALQPDKPQQGESVKDKHSKADAPQLPPVVEVPLQGCEAVVVRDRLQGGTSWAKNAPIEIRLKHTTHAAAAAAAATTSSPCTGFMSAPAPPLHNTAGGPGPQQGFTAQCSADLATSASTQGDAHVNLPYTNDGKHTEETPAQLLYGEPSFFFFAENGVAKEQWALALQAVYGSADTATSISTARAMYSAFCVALRSIVQVPLPRASPSLQQGEAAKYTGTGVQAQPANAQVGAAKQANAKQPAPARARAAPGPGGGGFGWFRGLFNRRGKQQQPSHPSNQVHAKDQQQQQQQQQDMAVVATTAGSAPAGACAAEAQLPQQGQAPHHHKADSHPLLALPSFMSSRTVSYAADRVLSELHAVKALQDGLQQQQQLLESGAGAELPQELPPLSNVAATAGKAARPQKPYNSMPGIPESGGDFSPTQAKQQDLQMDQQTCRPAHQHAADTEDSATLSTKTGQYLGCPNSALDAAGDNSHDAASFAERLQVEGSQAAPTSTPQPSHPITATIPPSPFQVAAVSDVTQATDIAAPFGSGPPAAAAEQGMPGTSALQTETVGGGSPRMHTHASGAPIEGDSPPRRRSRTNMPLAARVNSASVPNLLALDTTPIPISPPQDNVKEQLQLASRTAADSNDAALHGDRVGAIAGDTDIQHAVTSRTGVPEAIGQRSTSQLRRRHSLDQGSAASASTSPGLADRNANHKARQRSPGTGAGADQAAAVSGSTPPKAEETRPSQSFTHLPPPPTTGAAVDVLHGLNMFLVRLMYEFLRAPWFSRRLQTELQKLFTKLKLPAYLQPLVLEDLELGHSVPLIKAIRAVAGPANASPDGVMWPQLALDLVYTGRVAITAGTKVELQKAGIFNQLQSTLARLQGGTGVHDMHSPLGTSPSGSIAGDSPPNGLSPVSSCSSLTGLMEAVGQDSPATPTQARTQSGKVPTHLSTTPLVGKTGDTTQQDLRGQTLQHGLAASCPSLNGMSEATSLGAKAGASEPVISVHSGHHHEHHHHMSRHAGMGSAGVHADVPTSVGNSQQQQHGGHSSTSGPQGSAGQGGGFLGLGALTRAAAATAQQLSQQLVESLARMPVQLMLECAQFEATMLVWLSPPPSDRLWLSFQEAPRMTLSVRPVLGGRVLRYRALLGHVSGLITAKITRALYREMVFPACVDVKLGFFASPETTNQQLPLDIPIDAVPAAAVAATHEATSAASAATGQAAAQPAAAAAVASSATPAHPIPAALNSSTLAAVDDGNALSGTAATADAPSNAVAIPRPGLSANLPEGAAAAATLAGTGSGETTASQANTLLNHTVSGVSSKASSTLGQGPPQVRRGLFLGFRWRPWGQRAASTAAAHTGTGIPRTLSNGNLRTSGLSSASVPHATASQDVVGAQAAAADVQPAAAATPDPNANATGGLTTEDAGPLNGIANGGGQETAVENNKEAVSDVAMNGLPANSNAAASTPSSAPAVDGDAATATSTSAPGTNDTSLGMHKALPRIQTGTTSAATDALPAPEAADANEPTAREVAQTPKGAVPRGQRARQVVHGAAVVAGQSWRGVTWLGGAIGRAVRGRRGGSSAGPSSAASSAINTPKSSMPHISVDVATKLDESNAGPASEATNALAQQAPVTAGAGAVAEGMQESASEEQLAESTALAEVESFPCNVSSFASGTSGLSTRSVRINPSFLAATTANAAKLRNSITRRMSESGTTAPTHAAARASSTAGPAATLDSENPSMAGDSTHNALTVAASPQGLCAVEMDSRAQWPQVLSPSSPPALAVSASVRISRGSIGSLPGSMTSPESIRTPLRHAHSMMPLQHDVFISGGFGVVDETGRGVALSPASHSTAGGVPSPAPAPRATAAHLVPLPCGSMRVSSQRERQSGTVLTKTASFHFDRDLALTSSSMRQQHSLLGAPRSVSVGGAVTHVAVRDNALCSSLEHESSQCSSILEGQPSSVQPLYPSQSSGVMHGAEHSVHVAPPGRAAVATDLEGMSPAIDSDDLNEPDKALPVAAP